MAITNFDESIKRGNIPSIWIVYLYDNTGSYFTISTAPHSGYDNSFPIIKNKPSIRTSIDLSRSKSKTSDVSLVCFNEFAPSELLSEELVYGTNNYINQDVKIFQDFKNGTARQIYQGRLVDVSHNQDVCTLRIQSRRVWDFLTVPNENAHSRLIEDKTYVPIVYGDSFDKNTSFIYGSTDAGRRLYPTPVISINKNEIHTLMPRSYSDGSHCHLNYYFGGKVFMPFSSSTADNSAGIYDDTTHIEENVNILSTDPYYRQNAWIVGADYIDRNETGDVNRQFFTNTHHLFDENPDTWSTISVEIGQNSYNHYFGLTSGARSPYNNDQLFYNGIKFKIKCSVDATLSITPFYNQGASGELMVGYPVSESFTANTPRDLEYDWLSWSAGYRPDWNNPFGVVIQSTSGTLPFTISVQNLKVKLDNRVNVNSVGEMYDLHEVEYFYSGGDGLTQSWTGGNPSTAISTIQEAHRDILKRFTGLDEATPEGWSDLDSERANWKIAYWVNKPTDLKKVLEQMQFEGCFIFTQTSTGAMRYIHIPPSASLWSKVNWALDDTDIKNIKISHTPFSELQTTWKINYEKHPAEDGYMKTAEKTDSTVRTKWNIQTKENVREVNLDMLVDDGSGVQNFANYYFNIFGDVKLIITGEIVNPENWGIEVGDIVIFTSLTLKAFNKDLGASDYFIITDITRSIDGLKFKAREV
tara:strand:+ start:22343 stop:24436 length:2094 start_codon:yes stop_codon:yes gene_type:complete